VSQGNFLAGPAPRPDRLQLCALCGNRRGRHHGPHAERFMACPDDDSVWGFHPTQKFRPLPSSEGKS